MVFFLVDYRIKTYICKFREALDIWKSSIKKELLVALKSG